VCALHIKQFAIPMHLAHANMQIVEILCIFSLDYDGWGIVYLCASNEHCDDATFNLIYVVCLLLWTCENLSAHKLSWKCGKRLLYFSNTKIQVIEGCGNEVDEKALPDNITNVNAFNEHRFQFMLYLCKIKRTNIYLSCCVKDNFLFWCNEDSFVSENYFREF
jgi:hypothetical protein